MLLRVKLLIQVLTPAQFSVCYLFQTEKSAGKLKIANQVKKRSIKSVINEHQNIIDNFIISK